MQPPTVHALPASAPTVSRLIVAAAVCGVAIALSIAARSLRQQNDAVLEELRQIHELVETTAGGSRAVLSDVSGAFLGRADAPLTMVEFSDLQCPFCRAFHTTAFEEIKRDYIVTGKLRYFVRDFPLDTIHPRAIAAARAVRCAGEQRKQWDMRHAILTWSAALDADRLRRFARDLDIDAGRFDECVGDTERIDALWQRDRAEGGRIGVSGTPAFLVGRTTPGLLEGVRVSGAKPYAAFDATFKKLLDARGE